MTKRWKFDPSTPNGLYRIDDKGKFIVQEIPLPGGGAGKAREWCAADSHRGMVQGWDYDGLFAAAESFHEAYCPSCPDNRCLLGDALATARRAALSEE